MYKTPNSDRPNTKQSINLLYTRAITSRVNNRRNEKNKVQHTPLRVPSSDLLSVIQFFGALKFT